MIILTIFIVAVIGIGIFSGIISRGDFEEMTGWRSTAYAVFNRRKLEKMEFTGKLTADAWSETDVYSLENTAVLMKEPGKDFVVMNLTDLHMADFGYYGLYNPRLLSHIRTLVEGRKPDLITLSGDLFSTKSTVWSVRQLTDLMDSLGVPWAPIFGNHDGEGNCDLNYLVDVMVKSEYCLMQKGDPGMGVGNYIVNICEGDRIVHSIILMDAHGDGLWKNQIGWYKWAASGANAHSTVIMHIPLIQYQQAYDAAWDGVGWRDGFEAFGAVKEAICPETEEDIGFFAAIKAVGLTGNTICGHEHTNDFSILYEGVRLTYSMRLGIYGAHHPDNMGATSMTIHGDGTSTIEHHCLYPKKP